MVHIFFETGVDSVLEVPGNLTAGGGAFSARKISAHLPFK